MSDSIEDYLRSHGPCLSGDVALYLTNVLRISPAAARQRISRVEGQVKKLAYVTFPRKARFMYLEEQFGSHRYWQNLVDCLTQSNSAYGLALGALLQRGGVIPEAHFAIACGAPVRLTKHLSPETIFARLNQAGLLQKISVPALGACIALVQASGHYDEAGSDVRVRLITEEFLLAAVRDWARKLGIVSYDRVATREAETLPMVGMIAWDLTAPSYLSFLTKSNEAGGKAKPGFFVCDIFLGGRVNAAGIRPFVYKCRTLRQLRNVAPSIQMFIADRYTGEAFQLLKANGIISATPANLFGEEVAQGLIELSSVLKDAASRSIDPLRFDSLFKKFGKIEGAARQLRGTLFEYLAADIARKALGAQVRMNRVFRAEDGREAEADVIVIRDDISVTFIECKGYSPYGETPDKFVQRWIQHNVPVINGEARRHPDWKNLKLHFEFWATAPLTREGLAMVAQAEETIKASRYTIKLRLPDDILSICRDTHDHGLVAAFEKHFRRHDARVVPDSELLDIDAD